MKAVKGVYKNGKITLKEKLRARGPFEVVVVFPEASDDPWEEILNDPTPRPALIKVAETVRKQIAAGKAMPLDLDQL